MQSQCGVGANARPRTPGTPLATADAARFARGIFRGNRFAIQSRRTAAWPGGIRLRQRRFSVIGLSACRATRSRIGHPSSDRFAARATRSGDITPDTNLHEKLGVSTQGSGVRSLREELYSFPIPHLCSLRHRRRVGRAKRTAKRPQGPARQPDLLAHMEPYLWNREDAGNSRSCA